MSHYGLCNSNCNSMGIVNRITMVGLDIVDNDYCGFRPSKIGIGTLGVTVIRVTVKSIHADPSI